jgi:hypothetical protein
MHPVAFYRQQSSFRGQIRGGHCSEVAVILDPDSYGLWLDSGMRDVAAASELLKD